MPISQHQTFLTCSDQLYMRHNWVSISCSSAARMIKLLAKLSWLCVLGFLCAWWSDKRYTVHDVVYYSTVSGQRHGLNSQDWSTCNCSNQIVKNIVGWSGRQIHNPSQNHSTSEECWWLKASKTLHTLFIKFITLNYTPSLPLQSTRLHSVSLTSNQYNYHN